MSHADRQAGFTLLEMLVTLIVVALVLAAGAATMARRDMRPTPLQTALQMQAVLLQAQSEAIRTGRDTSMLIDVARRAYAFPADRTPVALPEGTAIRLQSAAEAASGEGRGRIVFRADGSSSGADIVLSDGSHDDVRIAVNWLTGLPRLIEAVPE